MAKNGLTWMVSCSCVEYMDYFCWDFSFFMWLWSIWKKKNHGTLCPIISEPPLSLSITVYILWNFHWWYPAGIPSSTRWPLSSWSSSSWTTSSSGGRLWSSSCGTAPTWASWSSTFQWRRSFWKCSPASQQRTILDFFFKMLFLGKTHKNKCSFRGRTSKRGRVGG